jgi:hypothetical protein
MSATRPLRSPKRGKKVSHRNPAKWRIRAYRHLPASDAGRPADRRLHGVFPHDDSPEKNSKVFPNFMRARVATGRRVSWQPRAAVGWWLDPSPPYSVGQMFVLRLQKRRGAFNDLAFNLRCGYTNGASTSAARIFDGELRNVIAISSLARMVNGGVKRLPFASSAIPVSKLDDRSRT